MKLLVWFKSIICKFMTIIEFCHRCGRRMPVVWWCGSNELWSEITGETEGGGCYCPTCFDFMARKKRIGVRFIANEEYRY